LEGIGEGNDGRVNASQGRCNGSNYRQFSSANVENQSLSQQACLTEIVFVALIKRVGLNMNDPERCLLAAGGDLIEADMA
jgi:hypothetical protein